VITLNNREIDWHEGMTISDLLSGVHEAHLYLVVKVNNRYVSRPYFDTFKIPDQAEILLIPMIAGG